MKSLVCFICAAAMILLTAIGAAATESASVFSFDYAFEEYWYDEDVPAALTGDFPVKSALLMEADSGRILYSLNENKPLPIASVTKVMVMLLIMEAVDVGRISMDDEVTVSDRAASMGGSQVYLEPGERMSVAELFKCLVVVSANDASVALAEHIYGSEDSFILAMNERAEELGMKNTHFVNTTGLDEDGHYSSALDVALVTRELLKHEKVLEYTTIWMDTIRNGAFGLANTNKLIRFYPGANGMKTGYTTDAKYCLSGTACRDGMTLIAVVLGGESSDERFATAKTMLDYGFANYRVYTPEKPYIEPIRVQRGVYDSCELEYESFSLLLEKVKEAKIEQRVVVEPFLTAPVEKGTVAGYLECLVDGELEVKVPLYTVNENPQIGFGDIFTRVLKKLLAFA